MGINEYWYISHQIEATVHIHHLKIYLGLMSKKCRGKGRAEMRGGGEDIDRVRGRGEGGINQV